jgi:hypothetical protein
MASLVDLVTSTSFLASRRALGRRDSRPVDHICPDYPGTPAIRSVDRSVECGGTRLAGRSFELDLDLPDTRHVEGVEDARRGAAKRISVVQ